MREEFSFKFKDITICFVRMYSDCWICSLPDLVALKLLRQVSDLSNVSVDELDITERLKNVLKAGNILFVYELIRCTQSELRRLPNFGVKSLKEVNYALAELNLELSK
jgi:DNA-directed RNA polymerase alpha subunit